MGLFAACWNFTDRGRGFVEGRGFAGDRDSTEGLGSAGGRGFVEGRDFIEEKEQSLGDKSVLGSAFATSFACTVAARLDSLEEAESRN